MDFKVLKSFLTVCETGNMTRAANQLFISQPALTRQIQELEHELDCVLFDRSTRSLSLTEKGWQFQKRAKDLLALADQVRNEMLESSEGLHGSIRIGCVESCVMELLAEKIKDFSTRHPAIQFQIHSADGDDLKALLDADKLDMAIFIEPVETAKYDRVPLHAIENWGLIVNNDDPLAARKIIEPSELTDMRLILPRRFIVVDDIKSWLQMSEPKLDIVAFTNLLSNGLALVSQRLGNMVCIEGAFKNRPTDKFKFIPIVPSRKIGHVLGRKRNKTLDKAAELFWEEFKKSKG